MDGSVASGYSIPVVSASSAYYVRWHRHVAPRVVCHEPQLVLNAVKEMPSRSFRTSQKKENKKDSILATVKYKRIDGQSRQQNRK